MNPTVSLLQIDYAIGESLSRSREGALLALQRVHFWVLASGAMGLLGLADESLFLRPVWFLSALSCLVACGGEIGAFRRARRCVRFEKYNREHVALVILDLARQDDPVAQIYADRMSGYLNASN